MLLAPTSGHLQSSPHVVHVSCEDVVGLELQNVQALANGSVPPLPKHLQMS